jgi:hypothetical protein
MSCALTGTARQTGSVSQSAGSVASVLGSVASVLGSVGDQPVEVRLRRLHLVRPDLIPYPLDIQVVC